ncbi:MAG: GumC family protein [Terriglobales bacterium]
MHAPPSAAPTVLPAVAGEPPTETDRLDIPLSYYWFLLRKNGSRIIALVLMVTAAVTVLALSLPKTYEGDAILRVDPSGVRVVGATQDSGASAVNARLLVATEAAVITSPAVEQKAIDALGLASDPEFQPKVAANASAIDRQVRLLRNVGTHISVSQPLDTFLLEIQFRSRNPQVAARAANGLAQAFMEHEYATRARALTDSTAYMSDQLDGLRAQMEQDQTALVNYESSHDVINADDQTNIYQARLSQINQEMTKAQAARMLAQASAQAVSEGSLVALLATPDGRKLIPLQDQYLEDQRELATLATIYGPNHPRYRQQVAVVQHDRQMLQQQAQQLAAQIQNHFRVAYRNEQLLSASLAQQKTAVDAFNMRAVRYQALKAAATSSTQLYYDLQKQIQDATVAAGQRSEDLRLISPAIPSDIPASPRIKLWAALALLLSSIIGIGAALLTGALDKSVTSAEQVERWFRLPVIGVLPQARSKTLLADLSPRHFPLLMAGDADGSRRTERLSAFQESILALHSALAFTLDSGSTALALTSSVPAEGKSTISGNLAAAMATLGRRTLLIDADMRKPSMHSKFGISRQPGFSNVLRGLCAPSDCFRPIGPNLTIMPAGSGCHNAVELLHLHLEDVLEQMRTQFDFVLLDCPPALGFADTAIIAGAAGSVLVVVHAGTTDRARVHSALRQLSSSGANLVGIILNQVSSKTGQYYGYYNADGYQYYAEEEAAAGQG